MSQTVDKSNLGYLGAEFQYQLAKEFMEEPKFFRDISSIVNQNSFTEPLLKRFVGIIKDFYSKWNEVPSYAAIEQEMRAKARTDIDIEEITALIDKVRKTSTIGVEESKERAMRFFLQQAWLKIANEIKESVEKGDEDGYAFCKKKIDELTLVGNEEEYGYSPYDLEDEALSPTFKCPISTGISKLDDALNGGLEKGKMGLIIGSAGFGKTTFSTALAAAGATTRTAHNNYEGFKVLQIYFEDDNVDIARKHFSRITQVESRLLTRDAETRAQIADTLDNYKDKELIKNNLRLKKFNTGTKSASDIETYIRRLTNSGFKPDLVILDYFECLIPEKGGYNSDSEYTREGITMRKLENMAKDLDIALWVPTQGNKDSFACGDLVTMDKAGGSVKKVQIAQVVISIARSIEDIDNSKATLAILKNRSGKSGLVFEDIKFDNGTSTISCDEVTTFDNSLMYQEHVNEVESNTEIALTRELRNQHRVSGIISPSTDF